MRKDDQQPRPGQVRRVAAPARRALGAIRHGVSAAADGVAAAAEPIVERVGQAIDDVERTWNERPGARVRRVRRMGSTPLLHVYDVHPDGRQARPVQVGTRTLDVALAAATSVAATSCRCDRSGATTGRPAGSDFARRRIV
jgi:hypothetical protein